jgi:hypothetical protein
MAMRCTLIQAAWATMCLVRTSQPMIDWARRLAERRGRPVAAVALARKLAGIMFAMWRDETPTKPSGARRRSSTASHQVRRRSQFSEPR